MYNTSETYGVGIRDVDTVDESELLSDACSDNSVSEAPSLVMLS